MIRHVVRYESISLTPRVLADALGVQTRRWPTRLRNFRPSFEKDFLFHTPNPIELEDAGSSVDVLERATTVHSFFSANKLGQRRRLQGFGLPIPWTSGVSTDEVPAGTRYVVRPLRHHSGLDYSLRDTAEHGAGEYASAVFEKDREYRVVFVFGTAVVCLRKRIPDGIAKDMPWNHAAGSTFSTINDVANSKLTRSGALEALARCPVVRSAHIVGADIMWKRPTEAFPEGEWCVVEFNSSPSLTIEGNVEKVANFIREHRA